MRSVVILIVAVAGCGSSSPTGSMDLSMHGAADLSVAAVADLSQAAVADLSGGAGAKCCNDPSNQGNSLGVGKYCDTSSMCTGMASLCATLGDPTQHFCTMLCQMGGNCGTGATCQCQGAQCGCTPDACVTPPPGC
jgi:hypothetical protein